MAGSRAKGTSMVFLQLTDGEWARARSQFAGLGFRLKRAGEAMTGLVARETARRIVENIKNRNYERYAGGDYPPLAPATVEKKAREGVSAPERSWVEHGDLIQHIKAKHLGGGQWMVGVEPDVYGQDANGTPDTLPLDRIAAMLEWGYDPLHIPARPVFRIEAERMKTDGAALGSIRQAFIDVLSAERTFEGNPFPEGETDE